MEAARCRWKLRHCWAGEGATYSSARCGGSSVPIEAETRRSRDDPLRSLAEEYGGSSAPTEVETPGTNHLDPWRLCRGSSAPAEAETSSSDSSRFGARECGGSSAPTEAETGRVHTQPRRGTIRCGGSSAPTEAGTISTQPVCPSRGPMWRQLGADGSRDGARRSGVQVTPRGVEAARRRRKSGTQILCRWCNADKKERVWR